jgi:predicted ArsR family transcriptional regulator
MRRGHDGRATSNRRETVLQALRETSGPSTINDVAGRLGVHPNTVRFHLSALVENGQVERVEATRRTAGRPPSMFRAVQGMDPAGPRRYRLLAELLVAGLATAPDAAARAAEAGRAWGRRRAGESSDARPADGPDHAVGALVGLLDEIGFAPEERRDGERRSIGLRHCPFLELADSGSAIVCPVHLGLMQGAMEAWHSPVAVDRLEPFAEPDLCLAHLTTGDPGPGTVGAR